ncbi:hypothetical protein ABW20_dc0103607 [Dactylellina cionopaga]|nr:hypothetical protein ABW20_dc0103607 [Dactylellina cionopaga]
MNSQEIASVIYPSQRQRNSYPSRSSSSDISSRSISRSRLYSSSYQYPYFRSNPSRMDSSAASSDEPKLSYSTGSGPYDEEFMDSQRGVLMDTHLDGMTEEIDLNKESFEREELKILRQKDGCYGFSGLLREL